MRRVLLSVASLSGSFVLPPHTAVANDGASVVGISVGSPNDGALRGGLALAPAAHIQLRWPDGPRWALPQLVRMLDRAALRVERHHPGSVLLVGELSRRGGGSLPGHSSHESGRDADVAFYYKDAQGRPVRTGRLMRVDATGRVDGNGELRFDETRTWRLVEAFLTDSEVVVQRIFISNSLRQRLLEEARRLGVSRKILDRADFALKQPTSGPAHDDHLHVRMACPRDQRDVCIADPIPRSERLREARASRGHGRD